MRRRLILVLAAGLTACAPSAAIRSSAPSSDAASAPPPSHSIRATAGSLAQDTIPGPGGMTLGQEVGAVMMGGFAGPLTPAVVNDWRLRQFGGLIILPANENAPDPNAIRQLIASLRSVMTHPLLAAADQEGGLVCFPQTGVPCLAGARQAGIEGPSAVESELTTMSAGLKALGFDIDIAPVADVWDGVHAVMRDRSYGQNPRSVAPLVAAAIAGMHAAGMYATAQTLANRDVTPLRAALVARVDLVMVGYLDAPSLDASIAAMSTELHTLRSGLGYQGIAISDDLEANASSAPDAAVQFLEDGGDMVVVAHHLDVADATYDAIHAAVLDGSYPRTQLDASVQKLLNLGLRFMP
jgi:beta-N-acetylhexosaminidase